MGHVHRHRHILNLHLHLRLSDIRGVRSLGSPLRRRLEELEGVVAEGLVLERHELRFPRLHSALRLLWRLRELWSPRLHDGSIILSRILDIIFRGWPLGEAAFSSCSDIWGSFPHHLRSGLRRP